MIVLLIVIVLAIAATIIFCMDILCDAKLKKLEIEDQKSERDNRLAEKGIELAEHQEKTKQMELEYQDKCGRIAEKICQRHLSGKEYTEIRGKIISDRY